MARTNRRDLVLCAGGQEDSTHTWVVDSPPGRNSFRIVVCSRRAQSAPSPKRHSWFRSLGAIAQMVLPLLAFWRTGP